MPHPVFVNRRAGFCIPETFEGQAAMHRSCPVIIWVLVNPPTDPFLLQYVRNCRPFESTPLISIARFWHFPFDPATEIYRFGVGICTIDPGGTFVGIIHRP